MKGIKGFTLIELLMTISIGAILVGIAVPTFIDLTQRNTISTTSNEMLGAILLARSEAVRQNGTTTFTPLANGWRVDAGALNLVNHVSDNASLSINGIILNYNATGRASLDNTDSIEISYGGTVKSRICLSLTGRPFIRLAEDGPCP